MKKLRTEELGRSSPEEALSGSRSPFVIILDELRSAHNVGSIFRTCDAFLVEELILCGITPYPPHREISKTALGSTNSIKWSYSERTEDAMIKLRSNGYKIIAVEHTDSSTQLQSLKFDDPEKKLAFVFGSEVNGISDNVLELCDLAVEIPMFGSKHSFNVSVCAGIVLWEAWSQHNRINL